MIARVYMRIVEQRYVPRETVTNLHSHPKNPHRGDLESIESSIAVNGFFGAVIAQEGSGIIGIGNHRFRASLKSGATHIPVFYVPWSDAELERAAMADNRTHDLGQGEDPTLLAEALARVSTETGSLEGTGYTEIDLKALEEEAAQIAKQAFESLGDGDGDDAKPDAPKHDPDEDDEAALKEHMPSVPVTREGDIWILGEHRIMCGDAFDHRNRHALIGRLQVSLIVTDPPYAIYGSSTGIGADVADDKMIRPFFENLARVCHRTIKDFGHIYLCCDWRSYATIYRANQSAKLSPKNCLVWDKGGGLGSSYANCHELISFFAKLPPPTAMKSTTHRGQRTVMGKNIIRENRVTGDERHHNAAKPVKLFALLMTNSSDTGDVVVDFFLGSGTSVLAAEQTGRKCFGFELEPKYCDLIVWRWEKLTGKKATRIPREELAPVSLAPDDLDPLVDPA